MLAHSKAPRRSTIAAALTLGALFAQPSAAAEIPETLRSLVLHPRSRTVVELELAGVTFATVGPFSDAPFLAWPAEEGAAPFTQDRDVVAAWLGRAAEGLGHPGLTAVDAGESTWRGDLVWDFQLERGGIPVRDAMVAVHWRSGRLVGLVNRLAQPVVRAEALPDGPASADLVFHAQRVDGGVALELARLIVEEQAGARIERVVSLDGQTLSTRVDTAPPPGGPGGTHEFTEYVIPLGSFPDQIGVDSAGRIWYTQPNDDLLSMFEPVGEKFRRFATPAAASGPDGMAVDRFDRLWTGLYYNGGLGMLDINTGTFANYPAPYGNSAMAIPTPARNGHVWVTDHNANRISEFDPSTNSWLNSYVLPTPSAWITAGVEHKPTSTMYFTEYNVNRLAIRAPGLPPTEVPVPGSGVAFPAMIGDKVYYSEWSAARIGVYDVVSGATMEFNFPINGENGGPAAATPDGRFVVGTRNTGYIMVFDPGTQTFGSYQIPSSFAGLKDGLTVDAGGVIWFTETGINKVAKLKLN